MVAFIKAEKNEPLVLLRYSVVRETGCFKASLGPALLFLPQPVAQSSLSSSQDTEFQICKQGRGPPPPCPLCRPHGLGAHTLAPSDFTGAAHPR